jgi:hypothetical protein
MKTLFQGLWLAGSLTVVISPHTKNTRSMYALDAGTENRSRARGAKTENLFSLAIQNYSNPVFCANVLLSAVYAINSLSTVLAAVTAVTDERADNILRQRFESFKWRLVGFLFSC